MALTFDELLEKLKQEEETLLVEILEIQSVDIVNRFEDFISNKYDYLLEEYDDLVEPDDED
ncbi:MAG: hypothetical protein QX189_02790 [Methylococcales bacterium]